MTRTEILVEIRVNGAWQTLGTVYKPLDARAMIARELNLAHVGPGPSRRWRMTRRRSTSAVLAERFDRLFPSGSRGLALRRDLAALPLYDYQFSQVKTKTQLVAMARRERQYSLRRSERSQSPRTINYWLRLADIWRRVLASQRKRAV